MMRRDGPPRLAAWLVRRVLDEAEWRTVAGELSEMMTARRENTTPWRARLWYWRQALGFVVRSVAVRGLRNRRGGGEVRLFDEWTADLRWAIRGLGRRPMFALVAVLTLALGIGANSAVFTFVNAHFLTPLPYDRPGELVLLWETGRNTDEVTTVSPGNYFSWRDEARSFTDIAAFNVNQVTLSGDAVAERVAASVVTPRFFDVLGVSAALGSTFDPQATRDSDGLQVVLSHSLWVRRYGSDPSIVGSDIRVNGRPYTVVGVLPAEYRQPERSLSWQSAEIWRPLDLSDQRDDHGARYLRTVARMRPGVTVEQARQEMDLIAMRLADAHPEANSGRGIHVRTLDEYLMGDARPTLMVLLLAGAAVLLIVCANVANMTLARGEERRREFAVRAALGSGRMRLVRQITVEGLVLSLAGATLGAALVYLGSDLLQAVQQRYFTGLVDVAVDARVIALTGGVALLAAVFFALPLAASVSRPELREALVEGGTRAGSGPRAGRTRNALVVSQVAIATSLLVLATLLVRSFTSLVGVQPGFQAEGVVTFELALPSTRYPDRATVTQYLRDVWSEVEAVPGVSGVGMVSDMPFTTENRGAPLRIEGLPYDPTDPPSVEYHVAFPEYFEVMRIPTIAGEIPPDGWETPELVPAVVNQRAAESFWPGRDPVGARFTFGRYGDADAIEMQVAAVVGNILDDGFAAAPDATVYVPFGAIPQRGMAVVARAAGEPGRLLSGIREAVSSVDPDIPAGDLRPLDGLLAESVARPRAASAISAAFALIAVLVACVGIYGVLSYAVQSRLREIAVRAALGASGSQITSMVLGQSTRLVALGLVLGLAGAVLAASAVSGLLFGVSRWDPLSMTMAVGILGTVATLAAWLPARRAVRVDPTEALRAD